MAPTEDGPSHSDQALVKGRKFRVTDHLWRRFQWAVRARGHRSASWVIREFMVSYVKKTEAMAERGTLPAQQQAAARARRRGVPGDPEQDGDPSRGDTSSRRSTY